MRFISFVGVCPSCNGADVIQVHRTFLERIATHPFSLLAYQCQDCQTRFFRYSKHTKLRIITLVGCAGLLFWIFFPGYDDMTTQSRFHSGVKVSPANVPERHAVRPEAAAAPAPQPVAAGLILMGARSRFEANWVETPSGLRITRLREGPFRDAGLKEDDVIVSVDDQPATDRLMLDVRDRISSGALLESVIVVQRADGLLSFTIR